MKVLIEAEIKPYEAMTNAYMVVRGNTVVADWMLIEDDQYLATIMDGEDGRFPSEPAARAWVLKQLGAKPALPIAVYMDGRLVAQLHDLADVEGYLNGNLSWRNKWNDGAVVGVRIMAPDGEYQVRGSAKDGGVRIEKKELGDV